MVPTLTPQKKKRAWGVGGGGKRGELELKNVT